MALLKFLVAVLILVSAYDVTINYMLKYRQKQEVPVAAEVKTWSSLSSILPVTLFSLGVGSTTIVMALMFQLWTRQPVRVDDKACAAPAQDGREEEEEGEGCGGGELEAAPGGGDPATAPAGEDKSSADNKNVFVLGQAMDDLPFKIEVKCECNLISFEERLTLVERAMCTNEELRLDQVSRMDHLELQMADLQRQVFSRGFLKAKKGMFDQQTCGDLEAVGTAVDDLEFRTTEDYLALQNLSQMIAETKKKMKEEEQAVLVEGKDAGGADAQSKPPGANSSSSAKPGGPKGEDTNAAAQTGNAKTNQRTNAGSRFVKNAVSQVSSVSCRVPVMRKASSPAPTTLAAASGGTEKKIKKWTTEQK